MGIKVIYNIMEKHPKKFLIPPILISFAFDLYFVNDLLISLILALPTVIFTHFYLVRLKGFFKKERNVRDKDGAQKYAFPSYHTGLATIFCLIQGSIFLLSMPIMIFLIAITALGRIELDMHDWRDVTAGILFVIPIAAIYYSLIHFIF